MQIRESAEEGQLSAAGARCLALVKRGRRGMVYQAGTADEWFEARNMLGATNKRGHPTIRIWIQILFGFLF